METEQEAAETEQEEAPRVRYVGAEAGAIPPVQAADDEDPHVRELKHKVAAFCTNHYDGDYRKAFDDYDSNLDGMMTKDEIVELLADAGVGNRLTRGMWANGILDKLDMNQDHGVSWAEFESVFKAPAATASAETAASSEREPSNPDSV